MSDDPWRKCSTCKKPLPYDATYWVCNVTTCNARNTAFVFCSVDCWDAHVPTMRHKDAWAEERRSPRRGEEPAERRPRPSAAESSGPTSAAAPARRKIEIRLKSSSTPATASADSGRLAPRPADEVLVVASKVKAYIKARSGLNTSASVMDALSEHVRALCDDAIRTAWKNERKTVLDRDVR